MEPERIGIIALWCLVALLAGRKARRGGPALWWGCVLVAAALATREHWEWNRTLYQAGRDWLREQGWYRDRVVFKVALGAALALVVGWVAWRAGKRWRSLGTDLRLVLLPMAAQVLYFTALSLSVDVWIPRAIARPPGRTVLGYSLAGLCVLGTLLPARARTTTRTTTRTTNGERA